MKRSEMVDRIKSLICKLGTNASQEFLANEILRGIEMAGMKPPRRETPVTAEDVVNSGYASIESIAHNWD